jgi:transposase-like protein
MAKHRTHSIEFKRQVVQEYLGGESLHALAKRHGISRSLIKVWVAKYEAGGSTATRLPPMCWPTMRHASRGTLGHAEVLVQIAREWLKVDAATLTRSRLNAFSRPFAV